MGRGILSFLILSGCLFGAEAPLVTAAAPSYTAASIVNAATQLPGDLGRYTIATVYGQNLSFTTHAVQSGDVSGGIMPNQLDGVTVFIYNTQVPLFFVSPTQINFVIPYELKPGDYPFRVARQALSGPQVTIHIGDYAPGFFVYNGNTLIATHADGKLLTADNPAVANEVIVLYAAGLGATAPDQKSQLISSLPAPLLDSNPVQIFFDGTPVNKTSILYAGITPGCAGLYQINVQLPGGISASPKVKVQVGSALSPEAVLAAVQQ